MAKKKRSRTSDFSFGDDKLSGNLPSKEQINTVVAKATNQEVEAENKKRIPFTSGCSFDNS